MLKNNNAKPTKELDPYVPGMFNGGLGQATPGLRKQTSIKPVFKMSKNANGTPTWAPIGSTGGGSVSSPNQFNLNSIIERPRLTNQASKFG